MGPAKLPTFKDVAMVLVGRYMNGFPVGVEKDGRPELLRFLLGAATATPRLMANFQP